MNCKICNDKLAEFHGDPAIQGWKCIKLDHKYWHIFTKDKAYHEEYYYKDYIIITSFFNKPFIFDIYKGNDKSNKNYLISLDYESWSQLPIENPNEFVNKLNRLLVFI